MPEEVPSNTEPRPRKKRAWGRLSGNGLDADSPRPMNPLTAALITRRRSRAVSEAPTMQADAEISPRSSLASKDESVRYDLRAVDGGVLVQRTTCRKAELQVLQTFHFARADAFERWCEVDPMRFDEPQLWEQLLRQGHELFNGSL
jgi:hypothetical protein